MKKKILAGLLSVAVLATLLCTPALAASKGGVLSTKRQELKQILAERKEKADTLHELVLQAREDAGIIPLTEDEKALLSSLKEEIAPLVSRLKALKTEYQDAKASGDTERMEAIKAEVNELKSAIQSKWEGLGELRDKVKANREKADSTYRTPSFKDAQKQRHALWQEAKAIREEIRGLVAQLREAKTAQNEELVLKLQTQIGEKLDTLAQNLSQRIALIDGLISDLLN